MEKYMATAPRSNPTPISAQAIENVLAFRTKPGAESIRGGETKELGTVDVSQFDKVRLVCDERIGSTCNVLVRMTIMEGNELVALLDQVLLTPHAQNTRVYDVPGTRLSISIDGIGAANTQGAVDVLLYGQF
jgi:type III secretion protein HrpB1